jgi:Cys-tRNA(Pro)/Cys-tRNA(Cys) deacylase
VAIAACSHTAVAYHPPMTTNETSANKEPPPREPAPGADQPPPGEPGPAEEPVTPAIRAIRATGIAHRVVGTERAGSAEEAARLQGIEMRQLLRTIVVRRGEDDYLFVLVPAGRRFDWPKLRELLGVRRMTLPDADEARAVTGYERYTITPFGSIRSWPVVVDASVVREPIASIGGGGFGVNLHLAPADLVAVLDAQVADVSQADPAEAG